MLLYEKTLSIDDFMSKEIKSSSSMLEFIWPGFFIIAVFVFGYVLEPFVVEYSIFMLFLVSFNCGM